MAFQRGYSPRVAARALHLKDNPQLWDVALAPVFCMGLFHATRRRLMTSWIVAVAVILLIIAVRALPPLWRGIVDLGVVVALAWGVAALWYYFALGLRGTELPVSADAPGP